MNNSTRVLFDKLSNLSTISPVAIKLIHKLGDPEVNKEEIASLIEMDEIIYSNVFKHLRSAAVAARRQPSDTNEAIDFLGLHGLRNLVFAVAAKKVYVDLELWSRAVFSASASKIIVEKLDYDPSDISNVYIAALMSSMGLLLLKTCYQQEYKEIHDMEDYLEEEKQRFGVTNIELSYEIARECNLPAKIQDLIEKQKLDWWDEDFKQENAVILIANTLYDSDCIDSREIEDTLDHEMLRRHKLDKIDIDMELVKKVKDEIANFI